MKERRFRFRLWHVLLGFTVTAISLWAIPALIDWYAWRDVRLWIDQCITEFESNPTKQHLYELYDGAHTYAISNYEADWNSNPNRITINTTSIREDAYFVLPPEKWVTDSNEALQLLKKYYKDR